MKKRNKKLLKIGGGIVLTLSSIYAINHIVFFLATLKEKLYTKNGKYYNHSTGKIHYTKTGSGSPLLLIHDLNNASSDYEWNETIKKFSKNHTVYTLDLLGCGRSDKPKITYTSYLYVKLISDFVKEIICDKPDAIVTGDAASLLIMTGKMYPSLFQHIILVNPTDFSEINRYPNKVDTYKKRLLEMPIIGTAIYNLCHSRTVIQNKFHSEYIFDNHTSTLKYVSRYFEAAHLKGSASKYLYASKQCNYLACNATEGFSHIQTPVCVILGEMMDYTTEFSDWMIALNPTAEVAIMDHTKYLPQIEEPEEFVAICNTFFREDTLN